MPRFVVLEHCFRGLHWDFMLEWGDVLRTWALERSPDTAGPIPADTLADHRIMYLDYEGPISGDRGSVTRWDGGTYELVDETPSSITVRLAGARSQAEVQIARDSETGRWRFRFVEP